MSNAERILCKQLVHSGHVLAAGVCLERRLLGTGVSRSRVIARWKAASRVYLVGGDLVLIFPEPELMDTRTAIGLPLVRLATSTDSFAGIPFEEDQFKELYIPPSALVVAKEGVVSVRPLGGRVDPSSWLNLDNYEIAETKPLGKPVAPPVEIMEETFDARSKFEGIPPPTAEMQSLLESLQKAQEEAKRAAERRGAGRSGQTGGAGYDPINKLLKALMELFGGPPPSGAGSGGNKSGAGGLPETWRPPDPQSLAIMLKLQGIIASFMAMTGIAGAIQARQAQYLAKMLDLLNRGEWDQALRYAIPLSDDQKAAGRQQDFLGMLAPRDMLKISFGFSTTGSGINLEQELFDHLKRLYRSAYERLAAAGKIDEAAFVLAELLQASEEAVQFLERHGRLKTAAELAEGRRLKPELVIRQWMIAGDVQRAVAIARLTGKFSEAIALIERTNPDLALALRTFWAHRLAENGDYAMAIDAVLPLRDYRPLTLAWLKLAMEAGGSGSGKLLARQLAIMPEYFREIEPLVLKLLSDRSRENAPNRLSFTTTLAESHSVFPQIVGLLRAANRSLLLDVADGYVAVTKKQLRQYCHSAADKAMWNDISGAPMPSALIPLTMQTPALRLVIEKANTGTRSINDAAVLSNGTCVIALGEAGVQLLGKDGRVSHHFDRIPAQRLVVADSGESIIAVGERGEAKRLTHINMRERKAIDLGEMLISNFPRSYDGSLWPVGRGDEINVLDVSGGQLKALWRLPNLTGNVTAINRDRTHCAFITGGLVEKDMFGRNIQQPEYRWERWSCDVLDLQLRNRITLPAETEFLVHRTVNPQGAVIDVTFSVAGGNLCAGVTVGDDPEVKPTFSMVGTHMREESLACRHSQLSECRSSVNKLWAALAVPYLDGWVCSLIYLPYRRVVMVVQLPGTEQVTPRVHGEFLTISDDRGRVNVIELGFGALIRTMHLS